MTITIYNLNTYIIYIYINYCSYLLSPKEMELVLSWLKMTCESIAKISDAFIHGL